jgi:hypothetical protein
MAPRMDFLVGAVREPPPRSPGLRPTPNPSGSQK